MSKLLTYKEFKDLFYSNHEQKDIGVKIPILERDNYHHWKVKMHLHLLSQDESYINCIENGPHIPHKVATATTATVAVGQSIPKSRAEWTPEDIEEVHKDKKAINILFNSLDKDMFDNVINSLSAKEIWDTVQLICEGTKQVRENKMQLIIQQYEYFHSEEGESLNDTFNRFQKLLNGLKLYGRVYQVKDSNLKFLRSLPKKWKPMTVSLRNSQDYKDFTLERLYGILKTYELEMEQDKLLEKGKRKGGSVALVAENERIEARNEEKTMPSLKIGISKSESSKGKEQAVEVEDNSSQDDSDDVDEHLAFLSRRFAKMKFKKNIRATKPNKNMVDKSNFKCYNCGTSGHFATVGANEDDNMEYVNLALMANSNENETSSSSNQVITTDLSQLSKDEYLNYPKRSLLAQLNQPEPLALALDWGSAVPTGSFLTGKEQKQYCTNELTSSPSHNDKTENNDHQVNMIMISSEQWIMI
ncbi:hypothetical protein AgCh_039664 [Apium graveolens]